MENSQKWGLYEQIATQVEFMKEAAPHNYRPDFQFMFDKFSKIKELKKNLQNDNFMLRKQYHMLLKEKSLYAQKLKKISTIVSQSELVTSHKIMAMIQTAKNQLKVLHKQPNQ